MDGLEFRIKTHNTYTHIHTYQHTYTHTHNTHTHTHTHTLTQTQQMLLKIVVADVFEIYVNLVICCNSMYHSLYKRSRTVL